MTISAALIARDAERTLTRCLDSFKGHVDEIVVVDTGSSDATKEIAHRYTEHVFDFPWRQDFSAARQFAFDRATGDWVMWVDADDVVVHADQIRPLVEAASEDVGGFRWKYVYARDERGNSCAELWRERCVRHDGSFRWTGRAHEVLVPQRPLQCVNSTKVWVEHLPEADSREKHSRRNLEILEAELVDGHGMPDARLMFYLGRERADAGLIRPAIKAFREYLRVSTWDEERYLAQTHIASLYRNLRRYDSAIDADLQALKIKPEFPEAYFGLAQSYYFLESWHRVVHWADIGRALPEPESLPITNPMEYRYHWIIYYTNALFRVDRTHEALEWTLRALEICPDDAWHRSNVTFFQQYLENASQRASDGS
jgi:glycosyltransferase involved in cell wall biosynthesis